MDSEDTLNYSDSDGYSIRERSNTWPNARHAFDQAPLHHHNSSFSPNSQCSSRLSLISESNESLNTSSALYYQQNSNDDSITLINVVTAGDQVVTTQQQQQQNFQQKPLAAIIAKRSSPSVPNYKAGHPSYVELITTAIMSSPEKRMTLSEIYDWMVANVSAFKDQRHLHSSAGWKNSVRHNLSLHSRFKRVKRNGMDKPSWWTVDLTEQTKDRKHRTPTKPTTGGRARSNTTTGAVYSPPKMQIIRQQQQQHQQQQQAAWRSANSVGSGDSPASGGSASACGGYAQLTTVADPFVPQVTMLNQNDLATVSANSSTTTTLYFKEENGVDFSPTSCSPRMHSFSSAPDDTSSDWKPPFRTVEDQPFYFLDDSAFASNTSLETMEIGATGVDLMSLSNLHKFARAITVTLRDQSGDNSKNDTATSGGGTSGHLSKPEIALQIVGDLSGVSTNHVNYIQQQLSIPSILSRFLRPSSAEDSRQILRVHSNAGAVQDVAVPAPLPIRIIIYANKEIQTDDLETSFEYGLNLHSPLNCTNPVSPGVSNNVCMTTSTPISSSGSSQYASSSGVQQMDQPSVSYTTTISSCVPSESNQMAAAISASLLPDDLAGVNVEGDMDCNIMDVLRYEMCCTDVQKPNAGGAVGASGAF